MGKVHQTLLNKFKGIVPNDDKRNSCSILPLKKWLQQIVPTLDPIKGAEWYYYLLQLDFLELLVYH